MIPLVAKSCQGSFLLLVVGITVNTDANLRTYAALSELQTFVPNFRVDLGDGCVPLEVLIDLRCESETFERLVPQTDAMFHYDKFNRLRLHNNVTSVVPWKSVESTTSVNHLQDQTDLIQVNIPRFMVSATDQNFQPISH
ncbi:hypothetical protein K435DRAFT_670225, partial [Dendrothele bispora CBS 962.96]